MRLERKQLLIGLLVLVIGGYLVNSLCDRFYFQPLAKETQTERSLKKKISDTKSKIRKVNKKLDQRDALRARALPSNTELASSLYQSWLINLVTSLGVSNPKVSSITPMTENDMTRLQFTLSGKANLKQFTNLLFEFYRAGHLHKIRQVVLTPTGGSEQMDLNLTVEAVSLKNSDNETSLTSVPSERLVSEKFEDYLGIPQRNLFGKGILSPAVRSTRLTAITSDRFGKQEAWFSIPQKNKVLYLEEGESTTIDSLELKVISVKQDSVLLEIDGNPGTLEVGKTLADIIPDSSLLSN
ncbi:MAG: hypothetical protein ACKO81_11075 [Planctomycetota bacterium]